MARRTARQIAASRRNLAKARAKRSRRKMTPQRKAKLIVRGSATAVGVTVGALAGQSVYHRRQRKSVSKATSQDWSAGLGNLRNAKRRTR